MPGSVVEGPGAHLARGLPAVLVLGSALSTQLGSALAVQLFTHTSPTFVAWLRNVVGAAALVALLALRRDLVLGGLSPGLTVVLGLALGTMNAAFYEGISRLPLGDAVA